MTEDLTPTSDSDPPPPTEAESPPPLNSSDKDISGSLDVQKQPQQLQQPGQAPPGAFPVHGQRPMLIQQGNSYYQFGLTKLRFNGKYVKYCYQQK